MGTVKKMRTKESPQNQYNEKNWYTAFKPPVKRQINKMDQKTEYTLLLPPGNIPHQQRQIP